MNLEPPFLFLQFLLMTVVAGGFLKYALDLMVRNRHRHVSRAIKDRADRYATWFAMATFTVYAVYVAFVVFR